MMIRPPHPEVVSFILLSWPPIAPPGAPKNRDHVKRHCGLESNISNDLLSCSRCSIEIIGTELRLLQHCWTRSGSTLRCRFSTAALTCPSWTTPLRLCAASSALATLDSVNDVYQLASISALFGFNIKFSSCANLDLIGSWNLDFDWNLEFCQFYQFCQLGFECPAL